MFGFLPQKINMQDIIDNSFKDFHAKGLDYICLHRSAEITIKIYLMEGVVSSAAEVVNPHDHRYIFDSWCLSGRMTNHEFIAARPNDPEAIVYETFDYMTPLNGGNGFNHIGQTKLKKLAGQDYAPGQVYRLFPGQLHTIQVYGEQTALLLVQYADEVPLDVPTKTYSLNKEPPSLSGLYNKFTADQIISNMEKLKKISGLVVNIV